MPIADISEVLLELGLSASVTDEERAIAAAAMTRAEGAVRRYLRYDPVQRSRMEFYPQMDTNYLPLPFAWESEGDQAVQRFEARAATRQLQLQHVPVRSVTTLHVDYDARSGNGRGIWRWVLGGKKEMLGLAPQISPYLADKSGRLEDALVEIEEASHART